MLNKILGSTQETKCTVGYKMAAFVIISFWRSLSIFLWWIKIWAKVCWNGNKYKAHCTLSVEESNNLMIKRVTQHLKHLLWPKNHASYQEAWKENTNGQGLKEGKAKCSARFVENFRKGKTCNTPEDQNKWFRNRQPESTYMYHGASEGHALTNVQENGISFNTAYYM